MLTFLKKSVITTLCILFASFLQAQHIRVATYNIRFDNPRDTLDLWEVRHPYVAGIIRLYDIDIFGTQEGLHHQLEDLKNQLSDFEYFGFGRDDGKQKGEHAAIFYNTKKYKLLESGTFWLSEITDRPNKGWDAALPRVTTWGKFREISSGKEFFLYNTHFDHMGETARKKSAELLIDKIRNLDPGVPVILTGDFNFDEKHPNYAILGSSGILKDAYELAKVRFAPGGTFTGFEITAIPKGRIDHIFVNDECDVLKYAILTNTYNGRYPSDHFAVFCEVNMTGD